MQVTAICVNILRLYAAKFGCALAEREACANEARRGDGWHDPSDRIAAAIRARSVGAPTSTK
jgi:hypothetical protein